MRSHGRFHWLARKLIRTTCVLFMDQQPEQVTQLLNAAVAGDTRAAQEFLPLVYEQLRRLAAARMTQQPPGQTLQATALVHEAWLRLAGSR